MIILMKRINYNNNKKKNFIFNQKLMNKIIKEKIVKKNKKIIKLCNNQLRDNKLKKRKIKLMKKKLLEEI